MLARRRRWALATVLVTLVAAPVVARARKEAREQLHERARLQALIAHLEPIAAHARIRGGGARRVLVNGAAIIVQTSTSSESVSAILDRAKDDCGSGDARRMLGFSSGGIAGAGAREDSRQLAIPRLTLLRVDSHQAQGAGAALCVFRAEGTDHPDGSRIRYSVARASTDGRVTTMVTVATESVTPLQMLFPAEGDAPGGDFEGVPRPPGSTRAFAATIEGEGYGVRIYESRTKRQPTIDAYDATMAAAGWSSSPAVAAALSDTRVYVRDARQIVASFVESDDEHTSVSIAPLMDTE